MSEESRSAFWEARWADGPGWDIGEPAPPFVSALARGDLGPPGRAAVLGCGAGHDALLLARAGFRVTGFDFAEPAIRAARENAARAGFAIDDDRLRFERRDIFTLPEDLLPVRSAASLRAVDPVEAHHAGVFDLVLEHTCFCAIDPARRAEYVDVAKALLRPPRGGQNGGRLVGLFYLKPLAEVGPPWPATVEEIDGLFLRSPGGFAPLFARAPDDSIAQRRGREWMAGFARR